jgi:4-amino-4-deoxy-L-arabinose transferase-like glycosyltransferase
MSGLDESRPILDIGARESEADFEAWTGAGPRVVERAEPNYRALATGTVAAATVLRYLSVARLPLGNGEAYYFTWSRFLDWSYYDHPPLVAWMVRLTTMLGTSPATVRLGPILAAGAFGLLFYRLAERLMRPRAAFFALLLVTALPVFLASSFIVNPEAPLAPLWLAFLLVVESMRKRDEPVLPVLAGALLGLAFLAKYTAILLVPATFVYVLAAKPMRRWLRRPSFFAGGAVALAVVSPVLFWNEAHGWASVRLHLAERAGVAAPVAGENTINQLVAVSSSSGTGVAESLGRVLVGQGMSYSPLLAPLLVLGIAWAARGAIKRRDNELFLSAFTWPVLVPLLGAMSVLKDAEQHWTMMAFIPATIAAGHLVDVAWPTRPGAPPRLPSLFPANPRASILSTARAMRGLYVGGLALSAVVFLVAHVHARTPALLRLIPAGQYDPRADMVNELVGWDQVRASIAQVVADTSRDSKARMVLASNHYSLCGRLVFETSDAPAVYCPTARRTAFDFFDRHDPPADATVLALTTDIHPEMPPGLAGRTCNAPETVDIERGGRRVARYFLRTCEPQANPELRASRDP